VRSEGTTGFGSRGAGRPAEKKLSRATAIPRVRWCTWEARSIVQATLAADEEAPLGIVTIVVCCLAAVEEYVDEGEVVEVAGEA
jgi:hypothetical protein